MKTSYASQFEEYLRAYLQELSYDSGIKECIAYAMQGGGKRLRPTLTLMLAEAYGVSAQSALPIALAVELIHGYSLVHDDLPCIDNDAMRRGKPSLHAAFGEGIAVLAGDIMLNAAFEHLLDTAVNAGDACYIPVARFIATCSGANGMAGGQFAELTGKTNTEEAILALYYKKTGALFAAAILAPLMYAAADKADIEAAFSFASEFGRIFQLTDDFIDIDDEDDKKPNFARLFGKERTQAVIDKSYQAAAASARKMQGTNGLISLLDKVINRKS